MNNEIIDAVNRDLAGFQESGLLFKPDESHTDRWNNLYANPRAQFIGRDGKINPEVMRNFWRNRIYAGDNPVRNPAWYSPLNILGPVRGERKILKRCASIIEKYGFENLLRKYPTPDVGNPHVYRYKDYQYTHRWFKSIYFVGLFNQYLADKLDENFVSLDIGSAFGIFPSLMHQEHDKSHQILVDMPEQLLLSRYFLQNYLPEAKIASVVDYENMQTITRDFLQHYDFILVHPQAYEKLDRGSVDVISSFACLGELKREFFDYYTHADAFKGAQYILTANPVKSAPMFPDSDITLLDFPVHEADKVIHFGVSPAFFHPYGYPEFRWLFLYKLRQFHTFFEYIGRL